MAMFFDETPELGKRVSDGMKECRIAGMEFKPSQNTGVKCAKVEFRVEQSDDPDDVGAAHWENYTLGNADDPEADDPATWKTGVGCKFFKNMLVKAQVPLTSDDEELIQNAIDQRLLIHFVTEIEPELDRRGQPNKYAGKERSKVKACYALGEREIGTGTAPPAPAARQAARPATPAARPATPPARPAAAAPKAAAPKPAAAKPTAARMMKCKACPDMAPIPESEFGAHVAEVHPPDEE